ncbi:MAG TPA: cytochrome b/b6 domain-containing protein [Steroidobacteraceae bacterium]|jgi:Ni/Fe-hydrogenase b-type cytochrome subunit
MDQQLYRRHAWPVRLTHWINAVALTLLLMSGLQIFNAHPSLYWGDSSYSGAGPILALQGFPSWLTVPSSQWLAMGRRWHFFCAWVLVINAAAYLAYTITSGHLTRDMAVRRADWRSIGRSFREHLRLHRPRGEDATRYNVLQKLSYLLVIFVLLPLMVLTGMAMSPRLDSLLPGWVDLLGGRQSARTLHFVTAWLLVLFAAIHVFEVIVTGFWNNLRSMITGRYRIPRAEGQP